MLTKENTSIIHFSLRIFLYKPSSYLGTASLRKAPNYEKIEQRPQALMLLASSDHHFSSWRLTTTKCWHLQSPCGWIKIKDMGPMGSGRLDLEFCCNRLDVRSSAAELVEVLAAEQRQQRKVGPLLFSQQNLSINSAPERKFRHQNFAPDLTSFIFSAA